MANEAWRSGALDWMLDTYCFLLCFRPGGGFFRNVFATTNCTLRDYSKWLHNLAVDCLGHSMLCGFALGNWGSVLASVLLSRDARGWVESGRARAGAQGSKPTAREQVYRQFHMQRDWTLYRSIHYTALHSCLLLAEPIPSSPASAKAMACSALT